MGGSVGKQRENKKRERTSKAAGKIRQTLHACVRACDRVVDDERQLRRRRRPGTSTDINTDIITDRFMLSALTFSRGSAKATILNAVRAVASGGAGKAGDLGGYGQTVARYD